MAMVNEQAVGVKQSWVQTFLPKTRWAKLAVLALAVLILGAGGVVAGKALHNGRLLAKWGWEDRTIRFAGAPVNKAEVAKYGEHIERVKLPDGACAKFSHEVKMADGAWCKTNVLTTGTSMWSFTLAVERLDELLTNAAIDPPPGVVATAGACGGSALIGIFAAGTPARDQEGVWTVTGWDAEQLDALNVWGAQVPNPLDVMHAGVYLFKAEVSAGGVGGTSAHSYKCFGWVTHGTGGGPPFVTSWIGDTDWSLAGTLAISNIRLRERKSEAAGGIYTAPRRWHHLSGATGWFTEIDPPTTTVATLGSMSVSYVIDLSPDPVTGEINFETSPVNPASFVSGLNYGPGAGNYALNTSYAEVQDIAMSSELVSPNCTASFYSTYSTADAPEKWQVALTPPTGAIWHFFNVGNTFKMHAVATGGSAPTDFGAHTWMRGPIKFNMRVGRGGYQNTFPVAGGWRCDMGLRRWLDEAGNTEIVWVGEGASPWYVGGVTTTSVDARGIWTGQILIDQVGGNVDEAWLTSAGELLAEGVCHNRQVKLLLPSLVDPLSGEYWGPVINLVWAEQSADIPPGYATPPSLWTAGTGATVAGTYGERWTITGATGIINRALRSRFAARMGYLATGYAVGKTPYIDDWIMIARANIFMPQDPAEVAAVCAVEDVTCYENSRCLIFTFENNYPTGLPANWQADATLKLTYDTFANLQDSCYTPAQHGGIDLRFGTDGFFECDLASNAFTFTGRKLTPTDTTSGLLFDLGQLRRVMGTDLRHVTALELTLPTAEFRLVDMRLAKDPDAHGVVAPATYPDFVAQPATDPWNWLQCAMGFGGAFEGVPCLNVPEGTESSPFSKDIQRGIKQTQHLQWNPMWLADQAEPPTYDPTFARNLNVRMVQLLVRQEQFTGSTLSAAVGPATIDNEANSLGFLYPWDLQRSGSDDNSLRGGIHVGSIQPYAFLAPTVLTGVWITHGRGHGLAHDGADFTRGDGACSDDATLHSIVFYRRPVDEAGTPTGPWVPCGSANPGVTGRFVSPPQPEAGYIYGLKSNAELAEPDIVSAFVTREYADFVATVTSTGGSLTSLVDVTRRLQVFYVQDNRIVRRLYEQDLITRGETTPVTEGGVPSHPSASTQGGVLDLLFIRDGSDVCWCRSLDQGRTFTVPTVLTSGYTIVEHEPLAGTQSALLLLFDGTHWQSVVALPDATTRHFTAAGLTGPTLVAADGAAVRGSLRLHPDRVGTFVYQNTAGEIVLLRCTQLKQDNSGAWA